MGEPIELVVRGERRRRWSVEDKLRIVAETREPGATLSRVARRHDVNTNLLYTWRRMAEGRPVRPATRAQLVPVRIATAAPAGGPVAGRIEIGLPDGTSVAIDANVSPGRLAEVLAVLRR
jgi:transposase